MFLLSDMEAECEILKRRLAVMEKQALGMRGAYECLVEALIKASINVADIDAKVSTLQAERTSLSSLLAERDSLSAQLAETTLRLEAVLQSTSWRLTRPLREAVKALSRVKGALERKLGSAEGRGAG